MKTASIVGAGLVGSLWAVYLSKAGYKVTIFERREDLRKTDISAGKSINLALSTRGWKALDAVGVGDEIREIAIPMYHRTMHDLEGNLTEQPYGQEGQAIFSVSRAGVNCKMMDIAEKYGDATIHYNVECTNADLKSGTLTLFDHTSQKEFTHTSDIVFAADGAFSAVRYRAMQKLPRFEYSQHFIPDGYREILLPANEDGSYKMDKNAMHIWPRGRFMLIALANEDGSFTCTLFMPHEGEGHSFENLKSNADVDAFFKEVFPDFHDMMPNVADTWEDYPLSPLGIIRCYPWTSGKVALMGDAVHATVPFYGQGMNGGFEDCSVMWELYEKHNGNWAEVFKEYEIRRKPDGDALQDLSLDNYYVMRDYVADPQFLLQKQFERRINKLYPDSYLPLYSQVSFSNIRYSEAYKKGKEQDDFIKSLMEQHDIETLMKENKLDDLIHQIFEKN